MIKQVLCSLIILQACVTKSNNLKISQTIFGVVENIKNGTDGYTAQIKDKDNNTYFAVISIPNMGPEGYKILKVGKKVALKGESWKLGEKKQIIVREILSEDNDNFVVNGKIQSLSNGTDGFTAKTLTKDGEVYFVTISIPNLGKNYTTLKEYQRGDVLRVQGELWNIGNKKYLTARNIINK